jgi:DegV family protein with EDD domain
MSRLSFCLVADASCDLPFEAMSHPQLRVLPVNVFVNDQHMLDRRDPPATQNFYRDFLKSPKAVHGRSEPMTSDEMVAAFNAQLALNFDQMLGVFVASSRSAIYQRAKVAVARARRDCFALRARAGKIEALQADCVDSQAFFAGYGAQVMDLLDWIDKGAGIADMIRRQQQTAPQTYAYMAPGEVGYILQRAALKGEKSVGAMAGLAAKVLSITPILRGHMGQTEPVDRKLGKLKARQAIIEIGRRMLEAQLLVAPHMCFSYSGALSDITELDSFAQLKTTANNKGIKLHLTHMSMTGSVNVGPGALVLGVLAKPHVAGDLL